MNSIITGVSIHSYDTLLSIITRHEPYFIYSYDTLLSIITQHDPCLMDLKGLILRGYLRLRINQTLYN